MVFNTFIQLNLFCIDGMKKLILILFVLQICVPLGLLAQKGKEYFVTVDPSTGHFNKVNYIPGVNWITIGPSHLTFDKINQIYFFKGDDSIGQWHLYGINANNGTIKYQPLYPSFSNPRDNIVELQYDKVTQKLYGLHWDNSKQTEFLVSIDPSTGGFSIIDSIPGVKLISTVSYTVFDEKNHLFMFKGCDLFGNWKLYAVDVLTGKVISSPNFTTFSNPIDNVTELKFNNTTHQLYGLHWDDTKQTEYFVSIDSGTAKINIIDSIPGVKWIHIMPNFTVIDENKNQYIFRGATANFDTYLYTIDIGTGKVVNKVDFPKVCGPDDNVIELHHDQTSNKLYALHWEVPLTKLRDTIACPNTPLYLNVPLNAKWSNGDSGRILKPTKPGYYSYQCRLMCDSSLKKDSLYVQFKYKPTGLPKDTVICQAKYMYLQAKKGYSAYLWNSKYVSSLIKVDSSGKYVLSVKDLDRCTYTDTINIKVIISRKPELGPNLNFCNPNGTALKEISGYPFKSYLWNGTDTNKIFNVKTDGYVQLETKDSYQCINRDTIYVSIGTGVKPQLGSDIHICPPTPATLKNLTSYKFLHYRWNDLDTNEVKTTITASTYILEVIDSNYCRNKDTMVVFYSNGYINPPNLGVQKFICIGDSILLGSKNLYSKYLWNGIDTSRNLLIKKEGTYYLEVWNAYGCKSMDSLKIIYYPLLNADLGPDKLFCKNDKTSLSLVSYNSYITSYLWSTGETKNSIVVNTPGTYRLTMSDDYGCKYTDSIHTKLYPVQKPNLGKDSALCKDASIQVKDYSGINFLSYSWSSGVLHGIAKTITAYPGNTVILVARDKNNCFSSDTVVYPVQKFPALSFPNDTNICRGDSLIVKINPNGSSLLWSDGATDSTRIFKSNSKNVLKVTTKGCDFYTNVNVILYDYPSVKLRHQSLCDNPEYTLDAGVAETYKWSTGERTRSITALGNHKYWVTAANGPCESTDSIELAYIERHAPYLPNAFSPNNDGLNDVFEPISNFELMDIKIYNRWGELLFESTGNSIKWDGIFKGQYCPAGVYVADISYTDCNAKTVHIAHPFELLRE